MNIYEAMVAAKAGKKVRCKDWAKGEFCTFGVTGYLNDEDGKLFVTGYLNDEDGKLFQMSHTSHLLGEWELYPEPVTKEDALKAMDYLEADMPVYSINPEASQLFKNEKAKQAAIVSKYLEQA